MANRRVLVKRRKAVRNIRKITRTMQLIATARFQQAHQRAVASKPYTEKLAELARQIARAAGTVAHPLLESREEPERTAVVVLTSMRGLCGGYNANVLRLAVEHLEGQRRRGIEPETHMVGKKGVAYFRFLGRPLAETVTVSDRPRFEEVEPIANRLMERFVAGEIDAAYVVYMRFVSASRQEPVAVRLLPLAETPVPEVAAEERRRSPADEPGRAIEFEFSPSPQELLDELLPATVRVRLFQAFIDAAVAEQVARMVAMKAATDAAEDMIRDLTRRYNRARQTQITLELLDIVGGANALA